jgi:hypothetical protein
MIAIQILVALHASGVMGRKMENAHLAVIANAIIVMMLRFVPLVSLNMEYLMGNVNRVMIFCVKHATLRVIANLVCGAMVKKITSVLLAMIATAMIVRMLQFALIVMLDLE